MLCGRVTNLLSAYIDRELAGAEMLQVREHLASCDRCAAEHADLGETKALLVRLPAPPPRGDFVGATMRRWHAAQAPVFEPRANQRSQWWVLRAARLGPIGQGVRVAALTTCLVIALIATGAMLRQPGTADAVVAGLPRAGAEEWQGRPWEANTGRRSAWRAFWSGAARSAPSEEQWLLLSFAYPAGDNEEESAVGRVLEIANRQPIGLSWAFD